ncbi:MAG: HDOD domain-containing protein [Firmicutes bacterium]|jgi:putative nucleotidyltransferase with HDIG domain|nr:HDOD domain-containing protein [Bacillota bacterium]
MKQLSLTQLVEAVEDLKPLPAIATRVIQLTEDIDSDISDIADAISSDQAITARLLRLSNSPFYGFARRTTTVREAVVRLGLAAIRSQVLIIASGDLLRRKLGGYSLEGLGLWRHSLAAAVCSRKLAARARSPLGEEFFTAGLLHDVGKVILHQHVRSAYEEILEAVSTSKAAWNEAESAVLGFDHALVGEQVALKWNLPQVLVEAIRHHHDPEQADSDGRLHACAVHIADAVCLMMGVGVGGDGLRYRLSTGALAALGLEGSDIQSLVADMVPALRDLESYLDI